jgi:hypothetical protein
MIRGLIQRKGRPLDRAYLIDAFELCLVSAQIYARYGWRYADLLTLRIVMNKYKTVSDYLHRDDVDKSADAVFCRRWELVGELVDKCMPHLDKYQVARLEAKLIEIAEKDTPEKLEADIQRWLHGSK